MPRQKKEHRITVSVPDDDHAALSEMALECDVSLSWITRQAISDFLSRHKAGEVQLPLDLSRKVASG